MLFTRKSTHKHHNRVYIYNIDYTTTQVTYYKYNIEHTHTRVNVVMIH